MIILLVIRLIKGMIKFVVFAVLILLGIYLILQNQSILNCLWIVEQDAVVEWALLS